MAKKEINAAEKYREERKARLAKAAKKNAKKSHKLNLSEKAKSAIAVVVVIAIFLSIGIPLGVKGYNNSASKEQKIMAVQYKDIEISKPVYSYFLTRMFNQVYSYAQQYAQYGIDMGYDVSVAPGEQAYVDELEGYENPTWLDYFDYSAKETIKQIEVYNEIAAELGITLDDEHKAELEENMTEIEESAAQYNVSANVFLQSSYGKGVTKALVRELIEKQLIAEMYMEHKQDEIKDAYTEKQVNKYYNDNKENYEVVSLRYYAVAAEKKETKGTDENGEETTNSAVTEATMAAAKKAAEAFKACKTDDAFKKAAAKHYKTVDKAGAQSYIDSDSMTLYANKTRNELSLSEDAIEWAFSAKQGETFIEENEGEGYTAYMVSVPAGKNLSEDKIYDVRHILVKFGEEETADAAQETADAETTKEEATEPAKEETEVKTLDVKGYGDTVIDLSVDADKAADKAAYKKAQDILEEYLGGKKTEDAFAALATKYTEDTGSAETGGLYENVPLGQMVPEFESWAVAEGRKPGDVGIVEHIGGASGYSGYHVMYCVGVESNGTAWEYNVKNDKAQEDFAEYAEELLAKDEYKITVINEDAVADALDYVTQMAQQAASSNG